MGDFPPGVNYLKEENLCQLFKSNRRKDRQTKGNSSTPFPNFVEMQDKKLSIRKMNIVHFHKEAVQKGKTNFGLVNTKIATDMEGPNDPRHEKQTLWLKNYFLKVFVVVIPKEGWARHLFSRDTCR